MILSDQAIFTSLARRGKSGYHLVSRSRGVLPAEAQALSGWAPSHGALLKDQANQVSVGFHGLPTGRFVLSRTCEGPPEFSGRGGRQLYTHMLVFDANALRAAGGQPFAIYRDALALGYPYFQPCPAEILDAVPLSSIHRPHDPAAWSRRAVELGLPALGPPRQKLTAGKPVQIAFAGDRALLAECLIGSLTPEVVRRTSFATSLEPSTTRPFLLSLVGAGSAVP